MSSFESAPDGFGRRQWTTGSERRRWPDDSLTEEDLDQLASTGVSEEPAPAGDAFMDLLAPGLALLGESDRAQLADLLDPMAGGDPAGP
jgi:hypothetical protein